MRSKIAVVSLSALIFTSGCGGLMGDPAPLVTFEVHNATTSELELRQWHVYDGHVGRDAGVDTDRNGSTVWRRLKPGVVTDILVQTGDGARLEAFDGGERLFCEAYDLRQAKRGSRYRVEIEAGHLSC